MVQATSLIDIVEAGGSTTGMGAVVVDGAHIPAYVDVDPVTGQAVNAIEASTDTYAKMIAFGAQYYTYDADNSTSLNLASNIAFTGIIKPAPSHGWISVEAFSNVKCRLEIQQFSDLGGTQVLEPKIEEFSDSINQIFALNGSFYRVVIRNIDTATSASLILKSFLCSGLVPTTRSGNLAVGIAEQAGRVGDAVRGLTYVVRNPNFSTGVAQSGFLGISAAGTTFANYITTQLGIYVANLSPARGKDLILKQLQLLVATVGTGFTNFDMIIVKDSGFRAVAGGTVLTPKSTLDSKNSIVADIRLIPTSVSADSSTTHQIARVRLKGAALVAGDVFKVNFGGEATAETGAINGTVATMYAQNMPAVVIPPQTCCLIYFIGSGGTASPTFEHQLEYIEQ